MERSQRPAVVRNRDAAEDSRAGQGAGLASSVPTVLKLQIFLVLCDHAVYFPPLDPILPFAAPVNSTGCTLAFLTGIWELGFLPSPCSLAMIFRMGTKTSSISQFCTQ